jgi:hypothetical protein
MPSSFSPSLRIELIAPGEQAGTWGTTTNTNLGTLVEDAIAGFETVSVITANQALTYADGAADQARNAVLQLTTTTGAAFSVYAPPDPKQYTIKNASSFAATIYNSTADGNTTAAGTGVTVPAGRTMAVWSDGTNFAVQNDRFVGELDGSVSSATTAVTQSTSDNSTKLATTAFVQAIKQSLHPVGSIYINATNNTNPATLLGFGTWTAFGAGRVPVGFNAADPLFDTAEETGGSKNTTLPSHTHTVSSSGTTGNQSVGHTHTFSGTTGGQSAGHVHSGSTSNPGNFITGSVGAVLNSAAAIFVDPTGVFSTSNPDPSNDVAAAGGSFVGAGRNFSISAGSHNHSFTTGGVSSDHNHGYSGTTSAASSTSHNHSVTVSGTTASAGSSGTNANLQPYITVYMWKRTA